MQLSTMQINATMMESMKGVNNVMTKVNEEMSVKNIQDVIREFSKNSEKFGLQQEMVSKEFLLYPCRWLSLWIWLSAEKK